jgi:hypothetical protein
MGTRRPTVALIHASQASMAPAVAAFVHEFPSAELWHILDDRLVTDADRAGRLTPELRNRMKTLIQYAIDGGADAVQLSCSMYGPIAFEAAESYPVAVLASDQAMFDHVAALRPDRVGVLGSLASAAADSADRLTAWLYTAGITSTVDHQVIRGAADAAGRRDREALQQSVGAAVTDMAESVDLIVLAQYSLAPSLPALAKAVTVPVLSPPHPAAAALARTLGRGLACTSGGTS